MSKVTVNIKKNLPSLDPEKWNKAADIGMFAGAKLIQSQAKILVPKGDGILSNSIVVTKVKMFLYKIGSVLNYALYKEYGTGKFAENGNGRKTPWVYFSKKYGFRKTEGVKATPYLRPAAFNNVQNITLLISKSLSRVL